MKRTHCPKGEVVFIGGRRVRWSQSKRGGVNFYTDDDCSVVVGEASEVVDCRTVGEELVARLESFAADLEAGKPINVLRNRKARVG
jgi:hypothetical protein